MSHFWKMQLTHELLKKHASLFVGQQFDVGKLNGPVLGNRVEWLFFNFLDQKGYDVPTKKRSGVDLPDLNIDIKALQLKGKRGGAAKIHGYSKNGEPKYSILIFGYTYDGSQIKIADVFFVPREFIKWVRAEHYLFSIPDSNLHAWRIEVDS